MNISDRILDLRKKKGISQEELAFKVGVSRQAVSKWESDQSLPDLDNIILMSKYFDVSTDYLLKGEEVKTKEENYNTIWSKVLYIASAFFLSIGLLAAFASWNEEHSKDAIWGSIIIQVIGVVAYYIGKLISKARAQYLLSLIDIALGLFIPLSLIINSTLNTAVGPYPTNNTGTLVFVGVYVVLIIITFFILKKNNERI